MRATKARMRSRATSSQDPVIILRQSISEQKTTTIRREEVPRVRQDATTIQKYRHHYDTPAHSGFSSLNLISYGDSMSTRNGNKVLLDSISLRGRCIVDKNSDPSLCQRGVNHDNLQIVVFLDTQCNGGSPTIDEFFDTQLISQDAFDCYTIAQYRQI